MCQSGRFSNVTVVSGTFLKLPQKVAKTYRALNTLITVPCFRNATVIITRVVKV